MPACTPFTSPFTKPPTEAPRDFERTSGLGFDEVPFVDTGCGTTVFELLVEPDMGVEEGLMAAG